MLGYVLATEVDFVLNAVELEKWYMTMTSSPLPDRVIPWSLKLAGKPCDPFEEFGEEAGKLMDRMTATMYYMEGQGLAAPQIGVFKKAAVIFFKSTLYPIFNPEILSEDGREVAHESCLSLVGSDRNGKLVQNFCRVPRAAKITIRYQNTQGSVILRDVKGHEARVIQHETDHLFGKFIIDRTGRMYREAVLKRHGYCVRSGGVYA